MGPIKGLLAESLGKKKRNMFCFTTCRPSVLEMKIHCAVSYQSLFICSSSDLCTFIYRRSFFPLGEKKRWSFKKWHYRFFRRLSLDFKLGLTVVKDKQDDWKKLRNFLSVYFFPAVTHVQYVWSSQILLALPRRPALSVLLSCHHVSLPTGGTRVPLDVTTTRETFHSEHQVRACEKSTFLKRVILQFSYRPFTWKPLFWRQFVGKKISANCGICWEIQFAFIE